MFLKNIIKKKSVLLLFLTCVPAYINAGKKHNYPRFYRSAFQPSWDDSLDLQAIEDRLRNEEIAGTERISKYLAKNDKVSKASDAMLLVTLESNLKAVFKPGEYHYAEIAAYRANKALGQRLVPPTVMRKIHGKQGSLQFLVESPIDLRKISRGVDLFRKVPAKDVSDMHIFYFVFGQWDNHLGNQLINIHHGKAHLALIDNAGILHRSFAHYGDYFFIEKGTNKKIRSECSIKFPFDGVKTLKAKTFQQLKNLFGPYISEKAIRKIWQRRKPITYNIWCGTLWVKMNDHMSNRPPAAKYYYASTLKAYAELTREDLEEFWKEWLRLDREHADQLISLTLERRDQLLQACQASGKIINDLKI